MALCRSCHTVIPCHCHLASPTGQAALRDRIADALATADGWVFAPGFKEGSPAYHGYLRQADAVLAVLLTDAERQFLTFALDEAAEEMFLRDGFTDEDQAALEKLRGLAAEAQP
jgi:hypothetical protein